MAWLSVYWAHSAARLRVRPKTLRQSVRMHRDGAAPLKVSLLFSHWLPQRANHRGVLFMALAMCLFLVNDAIVKYVSQSLPAAQLIFVRGCFATVFIVVLAWRGGAFRPRPSDGLSAWRRVTAPRVVARSLLDAGGTMVYLSSVFHLPLANATAINMATPLVIAVMARFTLGERVSTGRAITIVIGFVGVLLIVQPRAEGFNVWALVCLAGTLFHATRDLFTRFIPYDMPALLICVGSTVAVTSVAFVWMLLAGAWQPVTATQGALLACASVLLSLGYVALVGAMRTGEISVVAPFRYVGLLAALALGWAVWGDIPNALAFLGIVVLVGAGLAMLRR